MAVPAAAEAVSGRQRALAAGSPVDYMSITSFPRLPEEEPSGAAESGLRARKEEDAFLGEQDTGEGRQQSPPAAPGTPRPSAPRPERSSPGSRRPCAPAPRSPRGTEGSQRSRGSAQSFPGQPGMCSPTASLAFQPGPLVHGLLGCSMSISPSGMLFQHPSVWDAPSLRCSAGIKSGDHLIPKKILCLFLTDCFLLHS